MQQLSIADQVATLTLSAAPVNALSQAWVDAFERTLTTLEQRQDWVVLRVRSDLKVFCAGADLSLIHSWAPNPRRAEAMTAYVGRLQQAFRRLESLPGITLAEIGGAALGGGLELALSCDLRMAAAEARIGLPEVGLGLVPALGGTQRLTRLAGPGVASRLILGGEVVDGLTAQQLGIVQWAVPRASLDEAVTALVRRVAAYPRAAIALAKQMIEAAAGLHASGFALEREGAGRLLGSPQTQDLIEAFVRKGATKS